MPQAKRNHAVDLCSSWFLVISCCIAPSGISLVAESKESVCFFSFLLISDDRAIEVPCCVSVFLDISLLGLVDGKKKKGCTKEPELVAVIKHLFDDRKWSRKLSHELGR